MARKDTFVSDGAPELKGCQCEPKRWKIHTLSWDGPCCSNWVVHFRPGKSKVWPQNSESEVKKRGYNNEHVLARGFFKTQALATTKATIRIQGRVAIDDVGNWLVRAGIVADEDTVTVEQEEMGGMRRKGLEPDRDWEHFIENYGRSKRQKKTIMDRPLDKDWASDGPIGKQAGSPRSLEDKRYGAKRRETQKKDIN